MKRRNFMALTSVAVPVIGFCGQNFGKSMLTIPEQIACASDAADRIHKTFLDRPPASSNCPICGGNLNEKCYCHKCNTVVGHRFPRNEVGIESQVKRVDDSGFILSESPNPFIHIG